MSFRPASDAAVRPLDDRGVVIDMKSGRCWELNRVGFAIWRLVSEGKSVGETIDAVTARYGVSPGTSRNDVLSFLDSLVNAGLLEPQTSGTADRTDR